MQNMLLVFYQDALKHGLRISTLCVGQGLMDMFGEFDRVLTAEFGAGDGKSPVWVYPSCSTAASEQHGWPAGGF